MNSAEQRFWSKVDKTNGCWEWKASKYPGGYGHFWDGSGHIRAHRFAYELLVSSIPEGKELDHLCKNRGCVNPTHLEPVTHRENVLRGEGLTAKEARQTYCIRGHLLTGNNLDKYKLERGKRVCRTCKNEAMRHYIPPQK